MTTYFGENYDGRLFEKWEAINSEIRIFFEDVFAGGWSSLYCQLTWNALTLENEADLEIFDLLLKIDIKNGADPSEIILYLCQYGAFEAIKVRESLNKFQVTVLMDSSTIYNIRTSYNCVNLFNLFSSESESESLRLFQN